MEHPARPADPAAIRVLALVSGVVGVLAVLFLLGFSALEPFGVRLAGLSLGTVDAALGAVQFAALAPVVPAVGRRLPATRAVRVATVVAVAAAVAFVVLSLLLLTGVLTFAEQIGPVLLVIILLHGWLLLVNLVAHRNRALPRSVTRLGVLAGGGLLTGLVLAGAGSVLPRLGGQLSQGLGYALAGLAWLSLPIWVLLLGTRVFSRPSSAVGPTSAASSIGVHS